MTSESLPSESVNVDAALAKRLAEAADCFRDNLCHYFICKQSAPYDLHYTTGYESSEEASNEADSIKNDLGDDYNKYGPYKTDTDGEPDVAYDSIQLKFMQGDQEIYCETLTNDIDAVILSLSAYDKFFQPYYVRLYGVDAAAEFRTSIKNSFTSQIISLRHKGKSKISQPGSGGTFLLLGETVISS